MELRLHIDADEAPHHQTHVVRSSAVEHLIVTQEDAGSNPVAPPMYAVRFYADAMYVEESFTLPGAITVSGGAKSSPSIAQW